MKVSQKVIQLFVVIVVIGAAWPAWAGNWYVRPLGEAGGAKNGTSYADGWEGLGSVIWGSEGVQAGDTLFVCGTHYEWSGLSVGASGAASNRITVNGDCPGDVGTIWASEYFPVNVWTDNGNGTYQAPFVRHALSTGAQGQPGEEILMIPAESMSECIATDGSIWFDAPNNILYFNPVGALEQLMAFWGNSAIYLKGHDYVTITGSAANVFKLRGGRSGRGVVSVANGFQGYDTAEHITVQYADIAYSQFTGVRSGRASHHLQVLDNVFHDLPSAVYAVYSVPDAPQSNHLTIKRNEVYSGDREVQHRIFTLGIGDRQAMGSMNGDDIEISENYIHDWMGMGINIYMNDVGGTVTMKRFRITHNRIENLMGEDTQYTTGILVNGSSSATFSSRMEGGVIGYNTIKNCPRGAASSSGYGGGFRIKSGSQGQVLKIHNNTVSDCYYGLYSRNVSPEGSLGFEFVNNIIENPKVGGAFVYVESAPHDKQVLFKNNLYFSDNVSRFFYGYQERNFTNWMNVGELSNPDQDGTLTSAPQLTANLSPTSESPVKASGMALTTEHVGCLDPASTWPANVETVNQVSNGLAWDMGAYCVPESTPPETSELPSVVDPPGGMPLESAAVTFTWQPNGVAPSQWWLDVGTTRGANDLLNSGSISAGVRAYPVSGLPTNGRTVWVRLWYKLPDKWHHVDFQYLSVTTVSLSTPTITSPVPESTLTGNSATFRWQANGIASSQWWLDVGTTRGANNLLNSGSISAGARAYTVSSLPTNGNTIWVRLWYLQSGWEHVDVRYMAK